MLIEKEPFMEGLQLIGESINDSVPSTSKLFEAGDLEGIFELARFQDSKGADFLDVNVGVRTPKFMAEMVTEIQKVTKRPLSIDSPDRATVEAGLAAYDPEKSGGAKPLLNSISGLRTDWFEMTEIAPFRSVLLISETLIDGQAVACHTAEETYKTACHMLEMAHQAGLENDDLFFDPGIAPIGSDTENNLKRLLDALKMMHDDPQFDGVHALVGMSNFTVMLPPKKADGTPVKSILESAFLTKAMPLGLDTVIGSVKRNYQRLPHDHPAVVCLNEVIAASGFDGIMRVSNFCM
jgi:cobalamin-dependent methionine synthase I